MELLKPGWNLSSHLFTQLQFTEHLLCAECQGYGRSGSALTAKVGEKIIHKCDG